MQFIKLKQVLFKSSTQQRGNIFNQIYLQLRSNPGRFLYYYIVNSAEYRTLE